MKIHHAIIWATITLTALMGCAKKDLVQSPSPQPLPIIADNSALTKTYIASFSKEGACVVANGIDALSPIWKKEKDDEYKSLNTAGQAEYKYVSDKIVEIVEVLNAYRIKEREFILDSLTDVGKGTISALKNYWGLTDPVAIGQTPSQVENRTLVRNAYLYSNPGMNTVALDKDLDSIYNAFSKYKYLPESPLFYTAAFATPKSDANSTAAFIVGIGQPVNAAAKMGVPANVLLRGVITHEWGHLIQFSNGFSKYWKELYPNETPKSTMSNELEADFFSVLFLAHQMGGHIDAQTMYHLLEGRRNAGGCDPNSNNNHGTPAQRQRASYKAWDIVQKLPNDKKLIPFSPKEAHQLFIDHFNWIVKGD